MRRMPAFLLAVGFAGLLAVTGAPRPAAAAPARAAGVAAVTQTTVPGGPADDPDGDASTDDAPVPGGHIIPRPNSGREPEDAGDRGGALQVTVFLSIVAGLGAIGALAARDVRRAKRPPAAGPPPEAPLTPAGRTPRRPPDR
jgi:hypothetical protein